MAKLLQILIGAGLLAGAQLVHAQGASDLSIRPTQPLPETSAPAAPAGATLPGSATYGAADGAAGAAGTSGGVDTGTGAGATSTTDSSGASATGTGSGGLVVGTIVETAPPTEGQSAAAMSNDPFVQRREARAQAREEYRARKQAAREQLREERRAADSLIYQQSGR